MLVAPDTVRLQDSFLSRVQNVLICGGIGEGAQEALKEAGIKVISGAAGEVDAAVNAYLAGELESAGTNCDHHHEEGHSCCGQHEETATEEASAEEEHSCGGHCSGCSGCGGAHVPDFEGPNVGKTCRTHYRGTFDDGTQFDSSYDRGRAIGICMRSRTDDPWLR